MNDYPISFELSINGAKLIPTPAQFSAIAIAIEGVLFDDVRPATKVEVKQNTVVKSKGHALYRYSPAEMALLENRRLENVSYKKIAKEMLNLFGLKRTPGALYQALKKQQRENKKVDLSNEVLPSSTLPPLRRNEWGGTDNLKSPDVA